MQDNNLWLTLKCFPIKEVILKANQYVLPYGIWKPETNT